MSPLPNCPRSNRILVSLEVVQAGLVSCPDEALLPVLVVNGMIVGHAAVELAGIGSAELCYEQ